MKSINTDKQAHWDYTQLALTCRRYQKVKVWSLQLSSTGKWPGIPVHVRIICSRDIVFCFISSTPCTDSTISLVWFSDRDTTTRQMPSHVSCNHIESSLDQYSDLFVYLYDNIVYNFITLFLNMLTEFFLDIHSVYQGYILPHKTKIWGRLVRENVALNHL